MNLRELGWNDFFEAEWNSQERVGEVAARVRSQHREMWDVAGEFCEGRAEASGKLRLKAEHEQLWPVVGDWVAASGDASNGLMIRDVLPRRTQISRKMAGRRVAPQVLAANVDTIFVLMGLDGDFNARRVERYVAQGWETGARMAVLLTKTDLCESAQRRVEEVQGIAPGTEVFSISALTGAGLTSIEPYLREAQTVVLLGSSGVGKSTLVNRLLSSQQQATAAVRDGDSRGRHTTTARELFFLASGAMIIDTPGLRELQLWDAGEGVAGAFGDIEALAQRCLFRDCRHSGEPGCAVKVAIEKGELEAARLENHQKLLREQDFLERKMDKGAAAAVKERWKTMHRAAREEYRRREREGK